MTEKQHKEMSKKNKPKKKQLKAYGPMHMQPLEITMDSRLREENYVIYDSFLCFSF